MFEEPPQQSRSSGLLGEQSASPGRPTGTASLHPALAALRSAVEVCAAVEPQALADGVDVAELQRLAEAVQGLALRALGRFEASGGHAVASPDLGTHAHATAAAWLHQVAGLSLDDARARTRLGRRTAPGGDLALLGELLATGRTTLAHVSAVSRGVRGLSPEVVQASLPAIAVLVQHLDPVALARELRERAFAVSDELAREQERRQRERRGFWFPRTTDGVAHPKGLLPALEADVVEEALQRVMTRERAALDAEGQQDRRDLAQRRADALVTLARHALASETLGDGGPLVGAGGLRAAVTVVVDADRLRSDTRSASAGAAEPPGPARTTSAAQSVLSRATLLELTCDADTSTVTLGTASDGSRIVLDLGRTTRTVTSAQWRALVARDRTCVLAGCSRSAARCQAHHVQHWTRGGASDLGNYALVCHQHHHEIHRDDALWHRHRDGRWLTPDGYRPAWAAPPLASRVRYGPPSPLPATAA